MAKFLVSGGRTRDAHLLHDLDQVSATELQMQHVVEESLDATVGHVADRLWRSRSRPTDAFPSGPLWPLRPARMRRSLRPFGNCGSNEPDIRDLKQLFHQLNLLHATEFVQRFPVWPQPRKLVDLGMINLFGRERWSHMTRMMGLATAATFPAFAAGRWRRRGLDDVARRRLRRR